MEYWERIKRHKDYLQTIAAGDKVTIMTGYRLVIQNVTVTKVTKTQIVTVYPSGTEYRFRLDSGKEFGKTSRHDEILDPANAQEILERQAAEQLRNQLLNKIQSANWRNFNTNQLQQVADLIDHCDYLTTLRKAEEI